MDRLEAPSPPAGIDPATARRIRLVILDVDGVLTGAGIYVGTAGNTEIELKRFDIQDGLAIKILESRGVEVALVSGRVSMATQLRGEELGIKEIHQVPDARKMPAIRRMMRHRDISWGQVAMMGDDLPDIAPLRRAGLPVAVSNAIGEVRALAKWTSSKPGGRGAVREFVEAFLQARGEWDLAVDEYCREREG